MRTYLIFPIKGTEIDASKASIAIKKYKRRHPEQDGNIIIAVLKTQVTTEILEQGVVITETPKKSATIGFQLMTACGPEDSKPEHKDMN